MGLHRVTNCDVSLDGERDQAEGRGVDADVVAEDVKDAADVSGEPPVNGDVVAEDLVGDGGHQHDGVRDGEAHLQPREGFICVTAANRENPLRPPGAENGTVNQRRRPGNVPRT